MNTFHRALLVLVLLTAGFAPRAQAQPEAPTQGAALAPTPWRPAGPQSYTIPSDAPLVFDEEGDGRPDVVCYTGGPMGRHKWYSVNGGSLDCSPNAISSSDGVLKLTIYNNGKSWIGPYLRSVGITGEGTTVPSGKFIAEARIKLPSAVPPGLDPWPSWWFEGRLTRNSVSNLNNTTAPYTEIDVFELVGYRHSGGVNGLSLHLWPASPAESAVPTHISKTTDTTDFNPVDDQWHVYALAFDGSQYCAYYDKVLRGCMPKTDMTVTPQTQLNMILDLAYFGKPTADPAATYSIYLDYARIYALP
jgi:hypothetical protein